MRVEQDGDIADVPEIVFRHLMRDNVVDAPALDSLKGEFDELVDNSCYGWRSGREKLVLCFHNIIKIEGKVFFTQIYIYCILSWECSLLAWPTYNSAYN